MDISGTGGHYFWHVILNSTEVHSISTRQLRAEGKAGGGEGPREQEQFPQDSTRTKLPFSSGISQYLSTALMDRMPYFPLTRCSPESAREKGELADVFVCESKVMRKIKLDC